MQHCMHIKVCAHICTEYSSTGIKLNLKCPLDRFVYRLKGIHLVKI